MDLTRRTFVRSGAAALLASAVARSAGAAPAPSPRFIDVHTHHGPCWNHTKPLSVDGLLSWMDEHGTERAVVMPVVSPEASSYPLTTDFVLAQTAPFRDA